MSPTIRRIADFAAFRVWHSVDNLPFQEVWLILRRPLGDNGTLRFAFSNAPPETPLMRLAMMQCRRYWVERALEDAKGEAGLDQYQVRGLRPLGERVDRLAPPHDHDAVGDAFSVTTDDTVSQTSSPFNVTGCPRDTRKVLTPKILFTTGIY